MVEVNKKKEVVFLILNEQSNFGNYFAKTKVGAMKHPLYNFGIVIKHCLLSDHLINVTSPSSMIVSPSTNSTSANQVYTPTSNISPR